MADIQFKTVDTSKWEKLAPPKAEKPADKYTPVLDALESGEIIQIETKDDTEAKGIRISIGRKSRVRGFSVEYRIDGRTIYAKKSDKEPTKSKKEKVTVKA